MTPKQAHSKRIWRYVLSTALLIIITAFIFFTDIWYLRSGSMAPSYPKGSIIITSKLISPQIGSICAYSHNGITIVHRIISEDAEGYILKGDANNTADPASISANDIEGVMLFGLRPLLVLN